MPAALCFYYVVITTLRENEMLLLIQSVTITKEHGQQCEWLPTTCVCLLQSCYIKLVYVKMLMCFHESR